MALLRPNAAGVFYFRHVLQNEPVLVWSQDPIWWIASTAVLPWETWNFTWRRCVMICSGVNRFFAISAP